MKKKKEKLVTFKVTAEFYEKIKKLCDVREDTKSGVIRKLLVQEFKKENLNGKSY